MYAKHKRSLDFQTIYAFAHCEAWIENYARSNNLPASELTNRVGEIFLSLRQGSNENLPVLHEGSTLLHKGLAKVEVARRTYRKSQTKKTRKPYTRKSTRAYSPRKKKSGVKAYWESMTPEQRQFEMHRRRNLAERNRKAA